MFHAIPIAGSLPWYVSESSWVIGNRMRIFRDPLHMLIAVVTEVWKFGDFSSGWKVFDKQVTFCTVRDTQDTLLTTPKRECCGSLTLWHVVKQDWIMWLGNFIGCFMEKLIPHLLCWGVKLHFSSLDVMSPQDRSFSMLIHEVPLRYAKVDWCIVCCKCN